MRYTDRLPDRAGILLPEVDKPMTVIHCPKCDGRSNYSLLKRTSFEAPSHPADPVRCYAAFSCDNNDCHVVIGGVTHMQPSNGDELLDHWPMVPLGKEFPDVPEDIASAAGEAHRCISIRAGRAAIGLARSVIEAVAKKHGIDQGTVENKIDQMAAQSIIGDDTRDAAHAIRQWGNDAMHGDLALEPFDDQDAADVVSLMDDVIARAYQVRARTSSIVERRRQRRAQGPSTAT